MTDETRQTPAATVSHAAKPSQAQIKFLRQHLRVDLAKNGYLTKYAGKGNWPFIDRMATAGLVEIVDPDDRFPYNWQGTRITLAGRAAIEQLTAYQRPAASTLSRPERGEDA